MAFYHRGIHYLIGFIFEKGVKYVLPSIDHNSYKGFIFVATIGLLQTAGTMGLLYIAMSLGVSSSMSAVLLFTNPLWLAVLAHFILKERLTMIKVVALVIGVIGVTICLGLDRSLLGWGACVALLGSLCWSCNTVVTKQFKFDKGAWVLTGWRYYLVASSCS